MRHIQGYKIFEATSHWKDDLIKSLDWSRFEEILDFLSDFEDIGWVIPKKIDISGSCNKELFNSEFQYPNKKMDAVSNKYYQGCNIKLMNSSMSNINKEFFKTVLELLEKLEGYGYVYDISNIYWNSFFIKIYHPEEEIETSLIIKDVLKSSLKAKFGLDYAKEVLSRHDSIMNILDEVPENKNTTDWKSNRQLVITTKVHKYDIDHIYEIVRKVLPKFSVSKSGNRVIVKLK